MTINISFSDKTVRVAVEINGEIESAITELPQRTWVGLTDEDVKNFAAALWPLAEEYVSERLRAVEAKLRQKNGYAEEKNT